MKIEISFGKEKEEEKEDKNEPELMDEKKMAIGNKLKKNLTLTRIERKLLAEYLLKD